MFLKLIFNKKKFYLYYKSSPLLFQKMKKFHIFLILKFYIKNNTLIFYSLF